MTDEMYHLCREQNRLRYEIADLQTRIANEEFHANYNIITSLSIELCNLQSKYYDVQKKINELLLRESVAEVLK